MEEVVRLKNGDWVLSPDLGPLCFCAEDNEFVGEFNGHYESIELNEVAEWKLIPSPESDESGFWKTETPPDPDKTVLIALKTNEDTEPEDDDPLTLGGYIYQVGLSEGADGDILVSDGGDYVESYFGEGEEDFLYWHYIEG